MLEIKEIINQAIKARELSYSPYSNFKVGAAIEVKDGTIILGANIENCSYPLSICAERTAIFETYLRGYKKEDILQIAIVADSKDITTPCGACRQVLSELFPRDKRIISANLKGDFLVSTIEELLPYSFSKENLDK